MTTTALARVDEEIIRHELVFSNLAIQRNSLPFVFRLPTEILQIIFIHYARDCYEKRNLSPLYAPEWVKVSHVCRHWRAVALNCPTLWTYVCVTSERWTEELLARSKQAPLKITLAHSYEQDGGGAVREVMIHIERIQELYLHIFDPIAQLSFLYLFSRLFSRAPRLQNLEIWADSIRVHSEGCPVLFGGNTPALRTLKLSYCPVWWHSYRLSKLTTLSLARVPVRFQQNVAEFRAVLSRMQDLTHLYLDHALASAEGFLPSEVCNASSKIKLPRLSRLLVVAPLRTIVALLSCVNIPLETEVRLRCHAESGLDADIDYTPLSSLLAQRSGMSGDQALSGPTIRSLRIECDDEELGFAFSALERDCDCDTGISISRAEWNCNIPLLIVVDLNQRTMGRDRDRVIYGICRPMPLTNVQSLHILHPPFSPAFWRMTLGRLQDLRYIRLSNGYMPDLASVLSPTPDNCTENHGGHADRGSGQVFVPALEKLELRNITFSRGSENMPVADLRTFRRAVSTRKVSDDSRLKQVVMVGCRSSGRVVKSM